MARRHPLVAEFVSIPVPAERVQEVYELLARPPARPPVVASLSEDGYPEGWSGALMDTMFVESSGPMRRILCAIAQESPGWVTTARIAEMSTMSARQVVASLGPFEKRCRGRYGMSHWPFMAREFIDEGILKYSMSTETARRILELNAEFQEHKQAES
jgi:hypothetical protein